MKFKKSSVSKSNYFRSSASSRGPRIRRSISSLTYSGSSIRPYRSSARSATASAPGASNSTGVWSFRKNDMLSAGTVSKQKTALPFPLQWFVTLPYSNTEVLTASNLTASSATSYRLNSLYDPYYPTGGTQPYQYDQLTNIYSIYKVHQADVKITFFDPSTDGLVVGYRIRPSTNTTATNNQNVRVLGTMQNTKMMPLQNSGSQIRTFYGKVKMFKAIGITKGQYADEVAYQSSTAGNPSLDVLIEPFVLDMNGGTTATVKCSITIRYKAQLSGYYSPGES